MFHTQCHAVQWRHGAERGEGFSSTYVPKQRVVQCRLVSMERSSTLTGVRLAAKLRKCRVGASVPGGHLQPRHCAQCLARAEV